MELLRDDIEHAGFYGEFDASTLAGAIGLMPDPCGATLEERTFPAGGRPNVLRLHVQGVDNFNAAAAAPDNLTCLTGIKPGTDVILIRRAKTCIAGAAGCDAITAGRPYIQISTCATPPVAAASGATTHALAPSPNATEFVHLNRDCTTAAALRPYVIYVYFIGTDNRLNRAEFTGAGLGNVTPLVDGIENLQLDYGLDSAGNDGTADTYLSAAGIQTAATAAGVEPSTLWSEAVTVQINLLARNPEASPGHTDTKTYNLGPSAGTVGPFNDGFRRHVYSGLVRIQNISGRRERP
ncbi:MAG: hypothetical protein FJY56_14290 [Betaproteobacteria bacterium]|nr:hypothetical protein [Betaproteobacteria bacterium]